MIAQQIMLKHVPLQKAAQFCQLLLLIFFSTNSQASLIAFDLFDNQSRNLLGYNNPFEKAFTHSLEDSFQIHQQGITSISDGLLDHSATRSDQLGIVRAHQDFDQFFAVQDLNNPANPSGQATASWIFDIQKAGHLSFSLDIAAMGDFELSDWFRWDYSIDGLDKEPLFQINSDQNKTQAYQLAGGSLVTLHDPLTINDQLLSNHFQEFIAPIFGSGDQLELFFSAQQNGGGEVLAFKNLRVDGEVAQTSTSIDTPPTLPLLLLGLVGFGLRSLRSDDNINSRRI